MICCGYSQQALPDILQSDTTQIVVPVRVGSHEINQGLASDFLHFQLAAGHTLETAERGTVILSTVMCTAPSSMCNYLCRCQKR